MLLIYFFYKKIFNVASQTIKTLGKRVNCSASDYSTAKNYVVASQNIKTLGKQVNSAASNTISWKKIYNVASQTIQAWGKRVNSAASNNSFCKVFRISLQRAPFR